MSNSGKFGTFARVATGVDGISRAVSSGFPDGLTEDEVIANYDGGTDMAAALEEFRTARPVFR